MRGKNPHKNKLQQERLARGWSQEEVAEKLGVDVRTVRRWEGGQPVRPRNIAGLVRIFEKSANELGLIEEVDAPLNREGEKSTSLSSDDRLKQRSANPRLSAQPTALIGRARDILSVKQLLAREEVRLLTLTGSGGTGKTSLAVRVAHELHDAFDDGTYFVDLSPIQEPSLIATAIAQELGIWEVGGQALLDSLKTYVGDKRMLLLLDNFEQVISGTEMVASLLADCPMLKILVTSREVLRLRAEYVFVVQPLDLPDLSFGSTYSSIPPDLNTLFHNPAIELFAQRAQAINFDFQVTPENVVTLAEVCIRLDGLPLAIELAAARSKSLTPPALLKWLESRLLVLTGGSRDAPSRQQTLRDTIEWSYGLLSAKEQRLFRWLSIFSGGFRLETVEAFCQHLGATAVSALDGVDSLLDKSLLRRQQSGEEEQRFLMLETIREYGLEALVKEQERENVLRAHALAYLELAEQAEPELLGAQQVLWLERLENDSSNLRAAMQWWLEQFDYDGAEMALRMGGALPLFWDLRGYRSEGRRFLQQALTTKAGVAPSVRAKALDAAILLAINQSDLDEAVALCEENLTLCREHHNEQGIALAIHRMTWIAWAKGRLAEARSMGEGAQALFRTLKNKWGIADSLEIAATVALDQADYGRARSLIQESLALWRELGNDWGLAYSLWLLACVIFYSEGNGTRALPIIEEGLAHSRRLRHKSSISYALIIQGFIFFFQGDIDRARSIFEESMALAREIGDQRSIASGLYAFGWISFGQRDYLAARERYRESLALLHTLGHKWIAALSLEGLAMAVGAQEHSAKAARLWGAAAALREDIGASVPPINRALYEQLQGALRSHLGDDEFAKQQAAGRAMTLDEVLDATGVL